MGTSRQNSLICTPLKNKKCVFLTMSTKGKTVYLRYFFLLFFLFLLFPGWFFQMPQTGQTASGDIALHLARKYHLLFGSDVRLPYGPLGVLHSRLPIAVSILTYLFFDIYFLLTLFFILRKILAEYFHYAVIGFGVLAIGFTMRQGMDDWFFFFELFFLFTFLREPFRWRYLGLAAFPAAVGLFFRVDIGAFGVAIFLVTLCYSWLRQLLPTRIWILGSLLFLLAILVMGWTLHVDWKGYILTRLHSSDIIESRYSPSPAKDGLLFHLALEIALCMFYWTACLVLVAGFRKDWRKRSDEIFVCVVATLSLFFYFKTGFLRMDDALWRFFGSSVLLAALLYLFGPTDGWRKVPVLCCWIILVLCGLAVFLGKKPELPFDGITNGSFFKGRAKEIKRYLAGIGRYGETRSGLEAQTSRSNPLKAMAGSQPADILSWEVSALYFNGLPYSPRPTVQSFYTYNSWLDSINYSHYLSPQAPPNVLMSFDAVESHSAFFDEPRTKLALLDSYDPIAEFEDNLLLKNARRHRLVPTAESEVGVRLDEDINIASSDALQYSRFYIRYDPRGKLARFFDQPPGLQIVLTLADESTRTYRITKPMLEDGIIVNKFVDNKEEFQLLMQGRGQITSDVRKIRIRTDSAGIGFVPEFRMKNIYYRWKERTAGEQVADSLGVAALLQRHRPEPADPNVYRPDDVHAWLEQLDTSSQLIKLKGWAYKEKVDNKGLVVTPVLRSRDHFLTLPGWVLSRPDLVAAMGRNDLIDAGFTSVTARSLVPAGDYELGMAVGRRGDTARSIAFTGRHLLIRSRYSIEESGPIKILPNGNVLLKLNLERAVTWKGQVNFDGWAHLLTPDTSRRISIIVLSNKSRTYRISTDAVEREDVAASLKDPSANYAGFTASIPENKLAKGTYTVGVEQRTADGKYWSVLYSDLLEIGNENVIVPTPAHYLPGMHDFLSGVDHFDEQKEFFTISGWAIRDMKETVNSQIDLVLYKDQAMYLARTDPEKREDITEYYHNGLNLDNSGFTAKVSKTPLPAGKYQIGVWVHSKNNEGSFKLLPYFVVK